MKRIIKNGAAIALTLTSFIYATAPAFPQSPSVAQVPIPPDRGAPGDRLRGGAIWYEPPTPPDRGMPDGRIRGGASRGNCPATTQSLTALVPSLATASAAHSVWGLTTTEQPTFWFYIPYELTPRTPIEFVLLDEQENVIYQTDFRVTSPAGIVNITLNPTAPALEAGKLYHWYFLIYCSAENPVFTQGTIQRSAPDADLTTALLEASPRERAALYASNGFWFDALTILATLRQAEPNNGAIAADWASLLQSAGLDDVAQQPLVPCCTLR